MNEEKVERLTQHLTELGNWVRNHIDEQISKGLLKQEQVLVYRCNVTKFEYSQNGLGNHEESGQEVEREDWDQRSVLKILNSAKGTEAWKMLAAEFGAEHPVWSFVTRLTSIKLERGDLPEPMLEGITNDVLRECQGQAIGYDLELHISGLAILTEPFKIHLPDGIVYLRPIVRGDIEVERPLARPMGFPEHFDAVAVYDTTAVGISQAQKKVNWLLSLLRLAACGSVQNTSYAIDSNSCLSIASSGKFQAAVLGGKHRVGVVKEANRAQFVATCERVGEVLPSDIADEERTKVDPLAVAFHRFSDALFSRGVVERRIASAVMGIESMFMSDKDVIGYKLAMRLAKLLGYLGYEPLRVKKAVSDAYTIRSKFVHGDNLGTKEVTKLSNQYSGLDQLLSHCLTYLRSLLIVTLLAVKEKDKRIALTDEALIDDSKSSELRNALDPIKDIAGPQ
jgi:hypothetical protein